MPGVAAGGTGPAEGRARHRAPVPSRSLPRALRRWLPRSHPWPLAAVVGVLVLAAVAVVALLLGPPALRSGATTGPGGQGGAAVAAGAAPVAGVEQVAAVQALLDDRSAALLGRDRSRWLAGVDADVDAEAAAYAERQGAVFDRLAAVPLESWSWAYAGRGPDLPAQRAAALPPGAWVAEVTLSYRFTGVDSEPVHQPQHLTVVPRGGGWALATDADAATAPALWDLGPVSVVRSQRALLIGTAGSEVLRDFAPMADEAAERVDEAWGTDWPRTTVFQVPATQGELAQLLGRADDAGLDQIAAVTTGELVGTRGATEGDHVVVNPAGFSLLAPLGQQVVLTHELTHVATRATAVRAVPLWLSEGFADWVAYAGTDLPRAVVAAELLEQVRETGAPAGLPVEADFDPARTDVGPAYGGAWLAVDLLAERQGEQAVVAAYRQASAGPEPGPDASRDPVADGAEDGGEAAADAALAQVLHTDRAALVEDWRASLRRLAGPPDSGSGGGSGGSGGTSGSDG